MFWLSLLSSFLLLGESKQMTKGYQNDLFFTSHILFSISSKFQTMQSFASLQHCLLSVAFQSTHQILLLHFQGLLSLQERLLSFLVSLTFQSLSLSPGTFPLSPFLFPLFLHQLVHKINDFPLSLFLVN